MSDDFEVVRTKPVMLAYLERTVVQKQLAILIPALLDELNSWAEQHNMSSGKTSYVWYDFSAGTMCVRVGIPIPRKFKSEERIKWMKLGSL